MSAEVFDKKDEKSKKSPEEEELEESTYTPVKEADSDGGEPEPGH